jgi:hypothetical protein
MSASTGLGEGQSLAGCGIVRGQAPDWALSPLEIDTLGRHVGDRIEARFAPSPSVGRLGLLVHAPPLRVGRSARQQAADDALDLGKAQLDTRGVVADFPPSQKGPKRIIFAHGGIPNPGNNESGQALTP